MVYMYLLVDKFGRLCQVNTRCADVLSEGGIGAAVLMLCNSTTSVGPTQILAYPTSKCYICYGKKINVIG